MNDDLYYRSVRRTYPALLRRAETQLINCCWTISYVREFEAVLKKEGKLDLDENLSIQELLDMIPRNWIRFDGTLLYPYYGARDALINPGVVKEELNPLTYSLYQYPWYSYHALYEDVLRYCIGDMEFFSVHDFKGSEVRFEEFMRNFVRRSIPISVTINVYESFQFLQGSDVYRPLHDELEFIPKYLHTMLLTGEGTNRNGEDFWETQDSQGEGRGVNGYIRLAKHIGVIVLCSVITAQEDDET